MRVFSWLRMRPRALASGGIVTVVAITIATLAALYQGMPTTKVDLHDAGVWVTKSSAFLVGHYNDKSKLLDGALRGTSESIDVLQAGGTVVVVDSTSGTATVVDPAQVEMSASGQLPGGAKVALGGAALAVLDGKGRLWVLPAAAVSTFSDKTKPVADLGTGADVSVGRDGIVHAVSVKKREIVDIATDAQGNPGDPVHHALSELGGSATPTITSVGTRAIVLDARSGKLMTTDGVKAKFSPTDAAVLQQPSDDADAVAVATVGELVRVPLDGSATQKTEAGGDGEPTAPVQMAGCTYAAWSGSMRFVRDCAGERDDLKKDVAGATSASKLQFRVNRDIVVLNDVFGGSAWAATDALQKVDNWQDVVPPEGKDKKETDETDDEEVQTTLPKRSPHNSNPVANPDDYGVRPGRTTVLPVLENDTDPDGDVLTASVKSTKTSIGDLEPINDGGALQIRVPEKAEGSASFTYTADDGRGGRDDATVQLTVHPWDAPDSAPRQLRQMSLTMEDRGTLVYNVLPDWRDPDGDEMMLVAVQPAKGDEAEVSADGTLTYRAISGVLGPRDVKVTVSDGTKTGTGVLHIIVRPRGAVKPITNADHVIVRVDDTATVSPLLNDYAAGREPLRLTQVKPAAALTVTPDYTAGTFTVRGKSVGTYYVQYLVASGTQAADGIVRVDVIDAKQSDLPPIAVRDVALVQTGGDVLVNVLGNDSDPAGGILVVESVKVPESSGVTAAVLNHETVRIANQSILSKKGQVIVEYTISNGRKSATGSIVVIPIPAPEKLRPPVALDDTAVVRAGDIVTIPVLANDHDPNGSVMHVVPRLVAPLPDAKAGQIFVSQDTVRFRASDKAGVVYATYEVQNESGQKDAGYITIQVVPRNDENNAAPLPKALIARTVAGSIVHIPVPLDGIDPDGDSVELVGIASAPTKGLVTVGADELVYEALGTSSGEDSFTYRVRDRLGKEATATVRVGIAPAPSFNQAPFAVKDAITVRPGRVVAVPVLKNDSDPDGDAIHLVTDGLIPNGGVKAEVDGDRVVVTAPDKVGSASVQYTIRDSRESPAIGTIQITVKNDVPLIAPIARDDRVDPMMIKDGTAELDILKNDEDPDGTTSALKLTLDPGAQVVSGGKVRIRMQNDAQLIMYTITDVDGQSASAFIRVPGLDSLPPALKSTRPVEVKSGQRLELKVDDYVRAGDGGGVILTEASKVSAVHSNGDRLFTDGKTLVYTSASDYYGSDGLTFEVTDGTGTDDPKGHKATLTIPIKVLPPDNRPPTFLNGQLKVAPGEEASSLDLRGLTKDPDKGDLEQVAYQLDGGAPSGFTASIEGSTLKVSAAAETKKGTGATLRIRITDGHTPPVNGEVAVAVTASTRPLAAVNDDIVEEAHQGTTVTVPVLDNDVSPFEGKPLKVTSASVVTGDGLASVNGSNVEIAIDKSYVGQMVVRYRVQDATADVDREVEARILLTVQGKPDAPGKPTVTSVQDKTVVLNWTPPIDNGAEITGYTVESAVGGYSKQCASTTCTLDGLTNNVTYTFHVTATNRVGPSDPSPESEPARPDARPDQPEPPTLVFGDKSLEVSWKTPTTPGSPVLSYNLQISPAPLSGIASKTGVVGNSITWTGLDNGTEYKVQVQAVNSAPEPSSWSAWSLGETPAAPPAAPAAPTTQSLPEVPPQAQMEVDWVAPANNGDTISSYDLKVLQGGAVVKTLHPAGDATKQVIVLDTDTTPFTFQIRAINKAGPGGWSAESAPRRATNKPGAPTITSVTEGDQKLTVDYTLAAGNGAKPSEMTYQYSVDGGSSWRSNGNSGTMTISGLQNGGKYIVRLRAVATVDGAVGIGPASAPSAQQIPFGPVNDPGASASANGTSITFGWSQPALNGRSITVMEISIAGGAWENVGLSGTRSVNYGYSQTKGIRVKAKDSEGQWSQIASASARTVDPPAPEAWTTKGPSVYVPGECTDASCAKLVLNVKNYPAGDYTLACNGTGPYGGTWSARTYHVPSDGQVVMGCYFGDRGERAWVSINGNATTALTWY